jgi:starvation-inducible DNA-binding protein
MLSRDSKLLALNSSHLQHTRNLMSRESRQASVELLDCAIAAAMDLSLAARQAQWNVRGSNCAALHALFGEVARQLEEEATALAERAAALGGIPRGTAHSIAAASRLKPYPILGLEGDEHTSELALRTAELATEVRQSIYEIERHADPVTSHLLTLACGRVETILCRLESHLPPHEVDNVVPARFG